MEFGPIFFCLFTGSVAGEVQHDGLKEGWQLKFMVGDRCVPFSAHPMHLHQ